MRTREDHILAIVSVSSSAILKGNYTPKYLRKTLETALQEEEQRVRADAEALQTRVAILEKDKARWEWVKQKMAFAIMDAIIEHVEEQGGCVPGGITSTSIDRYIDSFISSEVTV